MPLTQIHTERATLSAPIIVLMTRPMGHDSLGFFGAAGLSMADGGKVGTVGTNNEVASLFGIEVWMVDPA